MRVIFWFIVFVLVNSGVCAQVENEGRAVLIKRVVREYLDSKFLNATFIFADEENILDMGARGVFSLETGTQLKVNEKMPIASGTKPITAVAILKLYDQGLIDINDKISRYIDLNSGMWHKSIPAWAEQVTVHHLLTHSSGLQEYFMQLDINPNLSLYEINKSILNFVAEKDLKFIPGTEYDYTNTNYIILGLIIEKVSGKSLAEFFYTEIFKPLGMNSSYLPEHREYVAMKFGEKKDIYPRRYCVTLRNNKRPILEELPNNIYFVPYADGGVVSNTRDVIRFYHALHKGNIFSQKTYNLMLGQYFQVPNDKLKTYVGYGVYISELPSGDKMIHHSGRSQGSVSESGYIPDQKLYFAIIGNTSPKESQITDKSKQEEQLDIEYFRDTVLHAILW